MKTMDSMGRLTIPKDIRERLNMQDGCDFNIITDGETIKLIPAITKHQIDDADMIALRKLFIMLKSTGILDSYYTKLMAKITKQSENKCYKCGENLFLASDDTFKCYNCD
jgi:AbrB family looped-hinge helix DNA binding protein